MEENSKDIKTLLEENLKMNQEILLLCKQIEHHNKLARIYGFIKTIIIIIPILIAVLYFIPYIGDIFKGLNEYRELMGDLLK